MKTRRTLGNKNRTLRLEQLEDRHLLSIVGNWHLDDGEGSTAVDSSPYSNDGTLVNMDPAEDWVDGKIVGALEFDGINDYVNCGNDASLNITEAITIEAWVKGTGQSVYYAGIVGKNAGSNGYLLRVSNNRVKFFLRHPDASPTHKMIQADDTLPIGEWTHCVAVRDNNDDMWLYINGVLQTDTANFSYSLNPSDYWGI